MSMKNNSGLILWLMIAVISAVAAGSYINTLSGEFVYDDKAQIVNNPFIKNTGNISKIFLSDVWSFENTSGARKPSNYYRPFMHLSYMLHYKLFGLTPFWYHLTNIFVHTGVTIAVFLLASFLLGKKDIGSENAAHIPNRFIALSAALLFASHPIHTEAVAWIAALPELAFSFFILVSLYLYITATEKNYLKNYLTAAVFFFIAALFKEQALILPLLIFIYDFFVIKTKKLNDLIRKFKSVFLSYLPYIIATMVYLFLRLYSLGGFAPHGKRHAALNTYQYLINIFPLFAQYLGKLIYPGDQNAFYVLHPVLSLFEARSLLSIIVFIAYCWLLFFTYIKDKLSFFCLSWIAVSLLPVLYIPVVGENTFADRYLYFPSIGFVILLAVISARLLGSIRGRWKDSGLRIVYGLFIFGIICFYTTNTIARNMVWENNYSLWTDTIKKSPETPFVHTDLGSAYQNRGMYAKAIEHYEKALQLKPDYIVAHSNTGMALVQQNKYDSAEKYLKNVIERSSLTHRHSGLLVALARALEEQSKIDEAILCNTKALELKPTSYPAHNNIGILFRKKGLLDDAEKHFNAALELNPDLPDARNNLALVYLDKGDVDKAILQLEKLLKYDPSVPEVHFNLGSLHLEQGHTETAIEYCKAAIKLNPKLMEGYQMLAKLYESTGDESKAKLYRQRAANCQ